MIRSLAWASLVIVGCDQATSGEEDDTEVPSDESDTSGQDGCDTGQPRQTWETFGQGFMTAQCQPCHASTAPDRFGAPESVVFDTEGDVFRLADRVLARATGEEPTMPPAGGPTPDDRVRLERWLTCESYGSTTE